MAERPTSLLPYVPKLALRLARGAPVPLQGPRGESLTACVLLADVSGFTELVDRLAATYGDLGAEKLQETLNACFGRLTSIVEAAGGEVLGFPGDSALAFWLSGPEEDRPLGGLVSASTVCGLNLQRALGRAAPLEGVELRLRVAIGAGPLVASLVGGVDDQWETIVHGEAVAQLAGALEAARPGEVALSGEASRLVDAGIGFPRGPHLIVTVAPDQVAADPPPPRRGADGDGEQVARWFVPPSLRARLEAGQTAWLAEFRHVTVLFGQVSGLAVTDPRMLQHVVQTAQTAVARYEGSVTQIVADEKGLNFVVGFGVAHRAHEDDAGRAVRAALAIRDASSEGDVTTRIGISTGRVFTGQRGGPSRTEFAILGPSVVLAARLAAAADDILCDAATRVACRRAIRFESLPARRLKGKAERIEVCRPVSVRTDAERDVAGVVGRQAERLLLERRLADLERQGQGGVLLLVGEPGMGKSALVKDLLRRAQSRAVRSLIGYADAIEQGGAYRPWRSVVTSLLDVATEPDRQTIGDRLAEALGGEDDRWFPLLNPVLPAPLQETRWTSDVDGETRARATRELMVRLLQRSAAKAPLLVVLEDAHWMDSASWELVEYAVPRVPRLLFLISLRPPADALHSVGRLRLRADTTTVLLESLSSDEIMELVCRRLNADAIHESAAALIQERAEGHPLFAAELAVALRDSGLLVVGDGTCRLAADDRPADQPLPTTVQGIVSTRIDRLSADQQLTLKIASVLGREFDLATLTALHPLAESSENVARQVAEVAIAGLLTRLEGGRWSFSHVIVQQVAYDLLPVTRRRELHRRAAEQLELVHADDLDGGAPVLAHHWDRAQVADRAMHYLERAGERALRDSSHREAQDFLTRLLTLADTAATESETVDVPGAGRLPTHQIRAARWQRLLSEAVGRQGLHSAALEHLERSITLLGHRVPTNRPGDLVEFLRGMVVRLLRRPRRAHAGARAGSTHLALLETTRAYEGFVQTLYLGLSDRGRTPQKNEVAIRSGLALLRSVRAAELLGPSAELSRTYSLFANQIAMFRRPRLAGRYADQGLAIAKQIGDERALFWALTTGQLPAFIVGRWQQTTAALEQALRLADDLRMRSLHECLVYECSLARVHFNQGRLDKALAHFREVRERAEREDDPVPQLWALVSMGEVALRQGRLDEAIAFGEDCLEMANRTKTKDLNTRFQAHGLLASARLRRDGVERAFQHLDPAVAAGEAGARLSFSPQAGFVGVAEVLLARWDEGSGEIGDTQMRLGRWLKSLRVMAFCRPILEPWDLVFRAAEARRRGRLALANRRLQRAIRVADGMDLAYESGYARVELARVLDEGLPARRAALEQARAIFSRIGALGALREAQQLERPS